MSVPFNVTAPWGGWFFTTMSSGRSVHYFPDGEMWALCRDGSGKPLVKLTMKHDSIAAKKKEVPQGACERCKQMHAIVAASR